MGNMTVAFSFVMFLNILMFLSQFAMITANPDSTIFYNSTDSLMENFDTGTGDLQIDAENIKDQLPGSVSAINPENSNYFTDIFNSISTWIKDSTGIKYIKSMALAPYLLLKAMRLPEAFCFGIGVLWYGCTIFISIMFLVGRE